MAYEYYYLYERSSQNYTSPSSINLSFTYSSEEHQIEYSVSANSSTIVNASIQFNGSGMLFSSERINISGIFSQEIVNAFFVSWQILKINSSGEEVICQNGSQDVSGISIGNMTKKEVLATCIPNQESYIGAQSNLTLKTILFNNASTSRNFTHYWNETFVSLEFLGKKLGIVNVTSANTTVSENSSFIQSCTVECFDGECINTSVSLQKNIDEQWVNIASFENITLNGGQENPVFVGNTSSIEVNFSLFANTASKNAVRCVVNSTYSSAVSSSVNISIIDDVPPSVTLLSPGNASSVLLANLTYFPLDFHLQNCSLWGNWSGGWQREQIILLPPNASIGYFGPISLSKGTYLWNVECADETTSSFAQNQTFSVQGDVEVLQENISFSKQNPVEGESISVYANISNKGNFTEEDVIVQLWRGLPGVGVQLGENKTVTLSPFSSVMVNETFTIDIGTTTIYVLVDPPNGSGSLLEVNELNNLAYAQLSVSIWQTYYGNISGNITLDDATNNTLIRRLLSTKSGNVFIADADTNNEITFSALRPLGYTATGETNSNTQNDFAELDASINTSSFADSVAISFLQENTTIPMTVFGSEIPFVYVINSSEDGIFKTGILWDSDDSEDSFYTGSEDIVFIAVIDEKKNGTFGIVDYEIRIPSKLNSYLGGSGSVVLYYEL